MLKTKSNPLFPRYTPSEKAIFSANLLHEIESSSKSVCGFPNETTSTFVAGNTLITWGTRISVERPTRHLDRVSFGGETIQFNKGVRLHLEESYEDGLHIVYNDLFGTYGSGATNDEALADFRESFVEFYFDIVKTPEESLGKSAIELKKLLISWTTLIENG